jgi:acyl-CoA reductase-like NAD-dependent aldehyde dehydrogenase
MVGVNEGIISTDLAPFGGVKESGTHPRFFDEQLGSAVGAIDYVRGSGN